MVDAGQTKITKRKLDDVITRLDEAFKPTQSTSNSSRQKRSRPTSTPALESLLASTSSALIAPEPLPPPLSYTPTSLPALLQRLSTYRLSSYLPSPPLSLSPLALSLKGFVNKGGRNRVECVTCHAGIILLEPIQGWTTQMGVRTRERYERVISSGAGDDSTEGHKMECPWRIRSCRRSLYNVGAKMGDSRSKVIGDLISRAKGIGKLEISLDDTGVTKEVLSRVMAAIKTKDDQVDLSEEAVVLGLFGWTIVSPGIISCHLCTRQISLSPYLISSSLPSTEVGTSVLSKQFNVITQHQPFCAYIDSSPLLPSSTSSSSLCSITLHDEHVDRSKAGWEKILEVVTGQPRVENGSSSLKKTTKELLSYVRGLLGPASKKQRVAPSVHS